MNDDFLEKIALKDLLEIKKYSILQICVILSFFILSVFIFIFNKENFYPVTFNFAISAFLITYLLKIFQFIHVCKTKFIKKYLFGIFLFAISWWFLHNIILDTNEYNYSIKILYIVIPSYIISLFTIYGMYKKLFFNNLFKYSFYIFLVICIPEIFLLLVHIIEILNFKMTILNNFALFIVIMIIFYVFIVFLCLFISILLELKYYNDCINLKSKDDLCP